MTDLAADLFGEPPLMKGEDKDRYFRLLAAVKHQIQPQDFFDEVRVHELTDKIWEQQRCKHSVAALVEGAYVEALSNLLRPFIAAPWRIMRLARSAPLPRGSAVPDRVQCRH